MMMTTTGNKRRVATNESSLLPEEMEMEVLLRLPVKSILRFKVACRRWAALLSSEEFCSSWKKIAESTTTEPAAQLLFLHLPPRTDERSTAVRSGDGRQLLTINAVRDLYHGRDGIALVPCSGLILLYDPMSHLGSYHVFNAATRAAAELPPPTPCQEGIPSSAGLGLDARTKEHKVVRLFCRNERIDCEVLALSRGSDHRWRPPTSFAATDGGVVPTTLVAAAVFTAFWYKTTPVFADGFLHWFVNPTTHMPAAVLSFSVADETFSSSWVRPPPFDWDVSGWAHHLTELDGRLCIVRDLRDDPAGLLEIWSYGAEAGWSLEHRIDLAARPLHVTVVGGTTVGKRKVIFIATSRCKVVAYDPMSGTLETILRFAEETSPLHYAREALTKVCLFKESLTPVH